MKKGCVFCGRSAPEVTMSKEHVVRALLGKRFPVKQTSTVMRHRYMDDSFTKIQERGLTIPRSPFDLTVNRVCKPCNEGWLESKVEVPAEDIISFLMNGLPFAINADSARALATWAAKTAAVRSLMDPGKRMIPDEHFGFIMSELAPPPGTQVFLANTEFCGDTFTRHHRMVFNAGKADEAACHLTTIILGSMALYVLGVAGDENSQGLQETAHRLEAHDTLRLWPRPVSARWPNGLLPFALAKEMSGIVIPSDALMSFPHASFDLRPGPLGSEGNK